MKILYCDCFSGISGDMFLSAMLDAGFPLDHLKAVFSALNLPEYQDVSFQKILKSGITAGRVQLDFTPESHHHRHYTDIRTLLETSALPPRIKEKSLRIFEKIARAEASVHGVSMDEVHFHEVGAVDSILDIAGAAAALDYFDIEKIYSSPLPLGTGQVQTQHGLLPIPAPATAWLLQDMQASVRPSTVRGELVTPTGAAILAAFATFAEPEMTIRGQGTGAGMKEFEHPNILRVFIGEAGATAKKYSEIETNLDDMTPELLGSVMNRLLEAGALDVTFSAIQMKKNRPATKLTVIAKTADEEKLSRLILEHTTTLGVRVTDLRRYEAERDEIRMETAFGPIQVKRKLLNGKVISARPEFEDCERISRETGLPIIEVSKKIQKMIDNPDR